MTGVVSDEILTRENTTQYNKWKAHPPDSPLNGGIYKFVFKELMFIPVDNWNVSHIK